MNSLNPKCCVTIQDTQGSLVFKKTDTKTAMTDGANVMILSIMLEGQKKNC